MSRPLQPEEAGARIAMVLFAGVTWLELPRGDHELVLRGRDGDQTFELDGVSGLDEWMVRTNPNTCFAVVDVTWVMYGTDDPCDHLEDARVTCYYRRFPKRELGSHAAFRVDDLPARAGRLETLWLDFPCNGPSAKPTAQELLAEELGCP